MQKTPRVSLSQTILNEILLHSDLYQQWASPTARRRANQEVWLSDEEWQKILADRERRRTVARLRQKKWIEDKQHGSQVVIKIAADAVIRELKSRIRHVDKKLADGQQCLVLFDFPNGANVARQAWREFLISAKFKREQLSVWTTDKDVGKMLCLLIQMLDLKKWVQVYQATRL